MLTFPSTGVVKCNITERINAYCIRIAIERAKGKKQNTVGKDVKPQDPHGVVLEWLIEQIYHLLMDLNIYPAGDGCVDARFQGLYQTSTIDAKCHAKEQGRPYLYVRELEDFCTDVRIQGARISDLHYQIYGWCFQEEFLQFVRQRTYEMVDFGKDYGLHYAIHINRLRKMSTLLEELKIRQHENEFNPPPRPKPIRKLQFKI
jgi:hypothetical protein